MVSKLRIIWKQTAFVLAYSTIMLNTDAHNPRLTGQARMSKEKFIESNRRTPDLAPLTDDFFSELYDEILVNEIKMEGAEDPVATAAASAATVSPRSSTPKGTPKGGQRKRRGSLSDMFAPGADGKALSVADQKQSFKELGQKMFDVQQRGIKGCPKKVQLGVNQVGLVVFDVKGRPTGSSILLMTMKGKSVMRA